MLNKIICFVWLLLWLKCNLKEFDQRRRFLVFPSGSRVTNYIFVRMWVTHSFIENKENYVIWDSSVMERLFEGNFWRENMPLRDRKVRCHHAIITHMKYRNFLFISEQCNCMKLNKTFPQSLKFWAYTEKELKNGLFALWYISFYS